MNNFLVLLLASSAIAAPEWITNVPLGYLNDYKVCHSSNYTNEAAEDAAIQSCIKEFLIEDKILVEKNELFLIRNNEKIQLNSKLKYNTPSQTIENLRVVEKYSEARTSYVMVSYPKKETDLSLPPSSSLISFKEFVFPGWGSSSIGQQHVASNRYLNSMVLILGSSISYYVMNSSYRSAREASTHKEFLEYREKAEFYRSWSVGLSISYLVYATYCAIDVKNSKYLTKYI